MAKSASQCRAELLPSPDGRNSLEEDCARLLIDDVPLVELLVLTTLSPIPPLDDTAVCVISLLIVDVSLSDFGVVPIAEAVATGMPPLFGVVC